MFGLPHFDILTIGVSLLIHSGYLPVYAFLVSSFLNMRMTID